MGLKWFARILMFFALSGYVLLAVWQFTPLGYKYLWAQDSHIVVKILTASYSMMCPISSFILWGLMLYDWGNRQFEKTSYKKIWILAMTFGMVLGSWIYYFVVFEMGITVKVRSGRSKTGQE